jgi:transposase-like protein
MRLSYTEQRIARLIATGDHTQAQVARLLGVSRKHVSITIRKLRELGLLWPSSATPGKTDQWWVGATDLRAPRPPPELSSCRVHNIRLKYQITRMDGLLSLDPLHTGYYRSWKMRNGERHKFLAAQQGPNMPAITLDLHPRSIVAYPDAQQRIIAPSMEVAEVRVLLAIHEAVQNFVLAQYYTGCTIEVHHPDEIGKIITQPHYAFRVSETLADGGTALPGWWVDHSEGPAEVETMDRGGASALDRGILRLLTHDRALEKIDALTEQVSRLTALMEGKNGE